MQAIEDAKWFDQTNQQAFGTTTRVCTVVWGCFAANEVQGAQTHAQTPLSNNPLPLPSLVWGTQACFSGGRRACLDHRGPDLRVGEVTNPECTHTHTYTQSVQTHNVSEATSEQTTGWVTRVTGRRVVGPGV